MSTVKDIQAYFSPDKIVKICEEEFDTLREQIITNLETKRTNSGAQVNSLGLPAYTTGETANSLRTIAEQNGIGLVVSFVGREGIQGIDKGYSPAEIHAEHGTVENLYYALKPWARAKESRYALTPNSINAWFVAQKLWEAGTVLYRQGGGTESITDLLQPTIERIDLRLTGVLDSTIYELLDKGIEL